MLTLTHILCPTDFSDVSTAAEAYAAALAARYEAQLSLLHVDPPMPISAPYGEIPVDVGLFEEQRAQAERELGAARERARTAGVPVQVAVVGGYPSRESWPQPSSRTSISSCWLSRPRRRRTPAARIGRREGAPQGAVPGAGGAGHGDTTRRVALRPDPLPDRRIGGLGGGGRVRGVPGPRNRRPPDAGLRRRAVARGRRIRARRHEVSTGRRSARHRDAARGDPGRGARVVPRRRAGRGRQAEHADPRDRRERRRRRDA